ncbi:SAV_6107 family HEPN domain-containing protein [Gordonia soli]|uniref:SAV-6107-like HEPN domain-containing protein n=1 Tax=Gordonia soli NBRC 108243 TaxID=1223545 RepID=M0QM99_9ACTN|nr:SAV_6107 family HEPN domain-containing protein [Gordonia soli]GAC69544.1 hypothetical protein GS4_25_01160 [Gordonia soli NBRC 108243]
MADTTVTIDPVVVQRGRDLLERADILFENADGVPDSAERFRQYYLAALRGAGAALALHEPRTRPARRVGSRDAWSRIATTVPALGDRAGRFASLSRTRMDIESGLVRSVDEQTVVGLRRQVAEFLDLVERLVIAYEQGKLAHQTVRHDRTA